MLNVSAGVYESTWAIIPPMNISPGWIADYAAEVKEVVSVPVATVGRINDPFIAESILLSGKADLIVMGRASLATRHCPINLLPVNMKISGPVSVASRAVWISFLKTNQSAVCPIPPWALSI
ncbi:MAG: hypothetical protein RQM92_11805 [Candidatus Syntrophopropionicum ammoniitolerans]